MRAVIAFCVLVFFACVSMQPAFAQDSGDKSQIQTIIRSQIEAFQHDDSATAYSYAAPSLKLVFPDADGFMAMVRRGYAPLYRPKSYSFGELKTVDDKLVQSVDVLGPDGDYWEAIYTFVRQDDGSWKIVSCYLIKAKDTTA